MTVKTKKEEGQNIKNIKNIIWHSLMFKNIASRNMKAKKSHFLIYQLYSYNDNLGASLCWKAIDKCLDLVLVEDINKSLMKRPVLKSRSTADYITLGPLMILQVLVHILCNNDAKSRWGCRTSWVVFICINEIFIKKA